MKTMPRKMPKPEASGNAAAPHDDDGRVRAIIDAVVPDIDGGRFAGKCIAGEPTELVAHCFTDGHDRLRVILHWRAADEAQAQAQEVEMTQGVNDEWHARVTFPAP